MKKVVNYLTNLLTGLEGEPGIAYSYILAKGGLYLRAKNEKLSSPVNIADVEVRGLAPISESIDLNSPVRYRVICSSWQSLNL